LLVRNSQSTTRLQRRARAGAQSVCASYKLDMAVAPTPSPAGNLAAGRNPPIYVTIAASKIKNTHATLYARPIKNVLVTSSMDIT
jgi:hypothetical protein